MSNVLKENTASIFRAEVSQTGKGVEETGSWKQVQTIRARDMRVAMRSQAAQIKPYTLKRVTQKQKALKGATMKKQEALKSATTNGSL
jgi:hypothetical protein